GEALDLLHMCGILGIDIDIRGSNDYKDIAGADIVVLTAGFIRKADMTRMDLLFKNSEIVKQVSEKIKEYAPNSKLIVVTNPLDVMTYIAYKTTGFGKQRVMGFSGPRGAGRFKTLVKRELKVSYKDMDVPIIGEHGETMVLLPRHTYICGKPLTELLPSEKISQLVEETRKMGAQVIKLKGWSASHAPGAGVAVMVESILRDQKRVIPTSVYLTGEYGVSDVCLVVPAVLGREGVEKVIELPLNDEEKQAFMKSFETVRNAISQLKL
ncbi:MAG: malate dehydrogenase, partial [Nitrososphaerota archaeon]